MKKVKVTAREDGKTYMGIFPKEQGERFFRKMRYRGNQANIIKVKNEKRDK